jgi:DNA-binding NtrC family response regulator
MSMERRVCLIEDDEIMGESLCERFELEGYRYDWYRTGAEALAGYGGRRYALILSDYRLPDIDGQQLFRRLQEQFNPLPPVLFVTGYGAIDKAVELLKMGAADYLTKPFDIDALFAKIGDLCVDVSTATPGSPAVSLGVSAAMRHIADTLPRLATHAHTILVTGESGSGKERIAAAIHSLGSPEGAPFVAVNCGAISEGLLEAELFGHEKGAFTGSTRSRKGVFEQADGGTLFLDEIGEMPLPMQVRLLRAVQERVVVRVGGETRIPVSVRLVCATNRDLKAMVEQGGFREDLYYRINVVQIRIPPLRERREDILWLAEQFLDECARQHSDQKRRLSAAAQQAILGYPWPGNVRELKHALERACILGAQPVLEVADLFEEPPLGPPVGADDDQSLADFLRGCERRYIVGALDAAHWQIAQTAERLGISRKNLWEKMKKLGIEARGGAHAD